MKKSTALKVFFTAVIAVFFLSAATVMAAEEAASLEDASVKLSFTSCTYNGAEKTPAVTVTMTIDGAETTLIEGTDYSVSYSDNINAGTATAIITGKGNFTGTVSKTFTIKQRSVNSSTTGKASVALSSTSFTYNGTAKTPAVTVTMTLNSVKTTLTEGTDYTVTYSDNTDAGTATVKITGKGNFTGAVSKTYTIKQRAINSSTTGKATVTLSKTSYTYNGAAKKPAVTVTMTLNSVKTTLTKGTDYTVTYSNNTDAGTATVKITGKGNFTGTVSKTYTINQRSINSSTTGKASVALSSTSFTYNGTAKKPTATVTMTLNSIKTTLTKGTDYTVSYSNNINAGTATVKITGKGNFTGTVSKTYTIKQRSVNSSTTGKASVALSSTSYTYNGKAKKPTATVTMTLNSVKTTLTKGTDYTVSYSNNTDVGTATVKITGKGNFTGTISKTYTIKPKAVTDISYTAASKGVKAEWSEVSGQVTGYQIQVATNSSFTSGKKTVTIKGKSTEVGGVSGLSAKKTYYVRMRTYKTVDGTKYYSSWSTAKKVTTLKKVTVFAGDSIMTGMKASSYNGISYVDISGTKKVIAKKSLNPYTFQTTIYSDEDTYLDAVLSYMPYRLYIMLGTNGIGYLSVSYLIENFEELVECIQEESPTTDIVILAVPPVTKSVATSRTGFKKISSLNDALEEMAEDYGINYYDYTSSFKTSSGYLKSDYNSGDGIHWNLAGYKKFAALITAYDAELED